MVDFEWDSNMKLMMFWSVITAYQVLVVLIVFLGLPRPAKWLCARLHIIICCFSNSILKPKLELCTSNSVPGFSTRSANWNWFLLCLVFVNFLISLWSLFLLLQVMGFCTVEGRLTKGATIYDGNWRIIIFSH